MAYDWQELLTAAQRARTVPLRPYQQAAVDAVKVAFYQGLNRVLVVLPTGCGKTVVFADLAQRVVAQGPRVLVLAHREELLYQAQEKLERLGLLCAIEQGKKLAGKAHVVIASVQTLQKERLAALRPSDFGLIIVDEAHHAPAPAYQAIFRHFRKNRFLGVTATPDRTDGIPLEKTFQRTVYKYDIKTAIEEGFLTPLRSRRCMVPSVRLERVRMLGGDFDAVALAKELTTEKALLELATTLLTQAENRPTMVFAVDVANANALALVLNRIRPRSAVAIDGKAKPALRAQILAAFRTGYFQFLINCALFTEGFDEPTIQCVAVARPTKSLGLFTQMVGRGTRLQAGKRDCLVLEFIGDGTSDVVSTLDIMAPGLDADVRERIIKSPAPIHEALNSVTL